MQGRQRHVLCLRSDGQWQDVHHVTTAATGCGRHVCDHAAGGLRQLVSARQVRQWEPAHLTACGQGPPCDRTLLHWCNQLTNRPSLPLLLRHSCYEIYGGKVYDLLNGRKKLEVREDGRKRVQVGQLEGRRGLAEPRGSWKAGADWLSHDSNKLRSKRGLQLLFAASKRLK